MADLTVKATLTGDASGLVAAGSAAAGALDAVQASATGANAAGAQLGSTFDAVTVAMQGQTAAAAAAASAIGASADAQLAQFAALEQQASAANNTIASIAALSAGQSAYNATVNEARTLLAAGTISQTEFSAAVNAATAQLALARAESSAGSAAFIAQRDAATAIGSGLVGLGSEAEEGAASLGHMGLAMERLGAATGVGMVNMRVFTEGVRGIAGVESVFGPVVVVALAAAAAIAALVMNQLQYDNSVTAIDEAAASQANALGQTNAQYLALAASMASVVDVSAASGNAMAAQLISANVNTAAWNTLAQSVRDFASATGTSLSAAMGTLASAVEDPAKGMQDLDDKYNVLNGDQVQLIAHLVAIGDTQDAQVAFADAIAAHFKGAADATSTWSDAFGQLETSASNALHAVDDWLAKSGAGTAFMVGAGVAGENSDEGESSVVTNPGPSAQQAAAARIAAQNNIDSRWLVGAGAAGNGLGFAGKIQTDEDNISHAENIQSNPNATASEQAQATQDLVGLTEQLTKDEKAQADAEQNLDQTGKKWLETIAQLIQHYPLQIAQASDLADSLTEQAGAINGSSYAMKALQDQQEIQKAIEPTVTALMHAHGAAAVTLTNNLAALTAQLEKQKDAQQQIAAMSDIKSQFGALSTFYSAPPGNPGSVTAPDSSFIQSQSSDVYTQDITDATNWATDITKIIQEWVAAHVQGAAQAQAAMDQYGQEVADVFNNKIAAAYTADLARRTDWQAGVERGLNTLNTTTANWAATSQNLVSGLSTNFENDLVNMVVTGKSTLGDFFTWIEEQLLKLAYQQLLAPQMNGLFGDLVSAMGSAMGMGDSDNPFAGDIGATSDAAGLSSSLTSAFSSVGDFLSGVFHTGGVVGSPGASRYIHPAYFDNAPRFHAGGIVGDEVPIIAQKGERVLTQQQNAAYEASQRPITIQMPDGAGSGPQVQVNVHNAPQGTQVSQSQGSNGGINIDVLVAQMEGKMANRVNNGKSTLSKALENAYKIKRSPT